MNTARQAHLADDIAHRYIALWNETDAARRLGMLADSWTADASYADPLAQASGAEGISALIAAVQARFPGFRFKLLGKPMRTASTCASRGRWAPKPAMT